MKRLLQLSALAVVLTLAGRSAGAIVLPPTPHCGDRCANPGAGGICKDLSHQFVELVRCECSGNGFWSC